jgi:hypothetical protein
MPITKRQGDDAARGCQSAPLYLSHCVLDIMESEEYIPSSSSNNYWSDLGEFISSTLHKKCLTVGSPVVVNSSSPKPPVSHNFSKLYVKFKLTVLAMQPPLSLPVASPSHLRSRFTIYNRDKCFVALRSYARLTGWTTEESYRHCPQRQSFFFSEASRPAVGPTQPPMPVSTGA